MSCRAQENLLVGKTVKVNDYAEYSKNIADGDKNTCMWFRAKNVQFAVFDLLKVHEIEKIVMYNGMFRGNIPFSIYMGDEFITCHFPKQFKNFRLCNNTFIQNQEQTEVRCNKTGNRGRYLALMKGQFVGPTLNEELNFCELEAYGKPLYDLAAITRPIVKDTELKKVTKEDFPLLGILRNNTPVAEVSGYTRSLVKLNKLCQPIIWDPKWNLTFALACETGNRKGRAAFFTKQWYFYYLRESERKAVMLNNYMKWLSPNKSNQELVASTTLKNKDDVFALNPGDIVDFYSETLHSDEVTEALIKVLNDGKISLMMDSNPSDTENKEAWKSAEKILDFFNVAVDEKFFTYGGNFEYSMKESDFSDELMDVDERLLKYLDNTEALLTNFDSLEAAFKRVPKRFLDKKDFSYIYLKYATKYNELLKYICPCKEEPAVNKKDRELITILTKFFESQSLVNSAYKLPCMDIYPGDFESPPQQSVATLEIYGEIKNTRNPTGFYLEAGGTLNYEIQSSEGDWSISVGCQSDYLPYRKPEWYRYPHLYIENIPIRDNGSVYSPYGGVIWISNNKENTTLRLKLYHVVATPLFNIHDKNATSDWDDVQRKKPGLWAQVAGEDLVICEKSEKLRNLSGEYLQRVMRSWDKLVRSLYALTSENWKSYRPEETAIDILPSVGYGHSGYPVVVQPDWYENIFDEAYIKRKGSWGMCHELGHNRQSGQWTFSTVTEATNNVFCLLAFPKIWNLPAYGSSLVELKNDVLEIRDYLESGAKYSAMIQSSTIELLMYVHLANSFGIGFYHEIFSYYTNHPEIKPKTDQEKIDMWIKVGSEITKMNLVPIHEFWGLPIGNITKESLQSKDCFLPDDYLTVLGQSRTTFILQKYPNCFRKSTYFKDFDINNFVQGQRPNFIKVIQN